MISPASIVSALTSAARDHSPAMARWIGQTHNSAEVEGIAIAISNGHVPQDQLRNDTRYMVWVKAGKGWERREAAPLWGAVLRDEWKLYVPAGGIVLPDGKRPGDAGCQERGGGVCEAKRSAPDNKGHVVPKRGPSTDDLPVPGYQWEVERDGSGVLAFNRQFQRMELGQRVGSDGKDTGVYRLRWFEPGERSAPVVFEGDRKHAIWEMEGRMGSRDWLPALADWKKSGAANSPSTEYSYDAGGRMYEISPWGGRKGYTPVIRRGSSIQEGVGQGWYLTADGKPTDKRKDAVSFDSRQDALDFFQESSPITLPKEPTRRKNPQSAILRNPSSNEEDCRGEIVLDSEGRSYPVVYRVIAAPVDGSLVVTSNNPQTFEFQSDPPLSYPAEFQTRDLSEPAEKAKILKIASSMEPVRLLSKNLDPTLGAPVVWPHNGRFYVLGGNGRTIAFLRAPERNYDRYLTMARCKWDCFPSEPAPEGSRWLLVREVVGLTKQQAVELAAASQKSTAASESPLAEAVGMIRSLHLSVTKMPPFDFDRLITADNIDTFRDRNEAFYNYIVSKLDEAKASNVQNRNSEAAKYMRFACIGFLPPAAQKPSLYDSPSMEDAIMGAAPIILTTHSLAAKGRLYPDYDLWEAMAAAVPIFARMQDKNLSMKAVKREVEAARAQTTIAGTKRDIDLPQISWALAMVLHNAAKTKKPETAIADLLSPYLDACKDACYRPAEQTMFASGLSDRCEKDQLSPVDLLLESLPKPKQEPGEETKYSVLRNDIYEVVYGRPAKGQGMGLFGNPYRINRGSKDDMPTVRKLVDLADQVSSRETDLPLSWYDPITPESARRFQEMNPAFYRHAVAHLVNDDWRDAADAIRGALLNTFPRAALEKLEKAPQLVQRNAVLAAPVMATLHAAAKRGEIPAHLDPVRFLPDGPKMLLHKKLSREMMAEFQDYAEAAYREDPRQYRLFALGNPTRVQSILFDRERWTALDARNWLRSHGYHGLELDRKANTLRFRQIEPEFFRRGTFRTIPFGDDGIQAVIGVPFGDPR